MTVRRDPLLPPWSLLAMVLLAVVAHPLLLLDVPLSRWVLPGCMLVAGIVRRPVLPDFGRWPVIVPVVVASLAIAAGALLTPDRSWDGFATWSLTARHLTAHGALDQPYFADPAVYQYGRGYPLLQPILLMQASSWLGEQGGRVLFPVLWLLLLGAVAGALRRADTARTPRDLAVAGLALMPIFVETGHGSAESGFADLLVALLLTHAAAGILLNHGALAACACLLLPLTKNEGTAHVLLVVVAAALANRKNAAVGAAVGGTLGLILWLPIQQRLLAPGVDVTPGLGTFVPAIAPAAACALAFALRDRRLRIPALVLLLATPFVLAVTGSFADSPVGGALRAVVGLELNWGGLPTIAWACLLDLVFVRKLGLTFVLLIVAVIAATRHRGMGPAAPLCGLLGLAGVAIGTFLAVAPPDTLALFLREGLLRYTAQWTGAAWLAIGVLLARLPAADSAAA